MARQRKHRVSEVARMSGISVRTLHYYDELGLLNPKARTSAGYRLYDDEDLLRLQQILMGREQGLSLESIRRSLDDPRFDRRQALLARKRELQKRAEETAAMIAAIDAAIGIINDRTGDENMDRKNLFAGFDPSRHDAEAERRWGHTHEYEESARRTKGYTANDWKQMRAEQAAIYADAFAALRAGSAPESVEAMDVAERHRLSIERWFYPCGVTLHASLADGYEADPRFAENIDRFGAGLTPFLAAAMRANARRHGG